jgi:hypothetical protein
VYLAYWLLLVETVEPVGDLRALQRGMIWRGRRGEVCRADAAKRKEWGAVAHSLKLHTVELCTCDACSSCIGDVLRNDR